MNKNKTLKNTLLFVHIPTHFKEMLRVARVMKQDDSYQPYVFFDVNYEGIDKHINQCKKENIQIINYAENTDIKIKFWFKIFKKFATPLIRVLKLFKF
ncbi:TPA: hypothetical protein ACWCZX_003177, partial [Legionella pneumophila]